MTSGRHRQTLLALLEGWGGAGCEAADMGPRLQHALAPYVHEMDTDWLGNVVGLRRGVGPDPRPRVMLAVHMDEIALFVSAIEPGGFLRMVQAGGFDPRVLIGQEVTVHGKDELVGVIGAKPPHLMAPGERDTAPALEELFVDLGMSEERVRAAVRVGDRITVRRSPIPLLGERLAGRAIDNRISFAVVLECLEDLRSRLHPADILVACTVQEELGSAGARAVAEKYRPDLAIVIDVTFGTSPGLPPHMSFELGRGPAITMGPNIHPRVFRALRDTAVAHGIPWQLETTQDTTGTDAGVIQLAAEGIPCGLVGVPIRYMHTSVEVADYRDVVDCGRLLARYLARLSREEVEGLTCF
ncbi:MAG: M20/M25/M40 family metallo-hydrolase [Thermoflavifilum sp.]|nr:M20/M25/M40 family metallo-hydrolase [Thermoflavifilum sp.]MCL6513963.1 M20/M25/M40 family metallo-hydrolase [Alicyclobacillus sp.]